MSDEKKEKVLYLDIDNILETYSADHDHIYQCTESNREVFLDKFAAQWRELAAKSLYEREE